jgi:hypothetical protein
MNRTPFRKSFSLLACAAVVLCVAATLASAQQPAAPARPVIGSPPPVAPAPAPPNDPAVQSILDTNPKTPAELMQASIALAALDRADLAKTLLRQLIGAKPDATTSAGLVHRFGSAAFLRLADDPRIKPEGALLAQQVLGTAAAAAHDPNRLAAAVQKLASPSTDVQRDALATLHDGGAYAVPPLLAALANPAQASIHQFAEGAVISLGSDAVKPLVAALRAKNPSSVIEAIRLLAAIGNKESAIYLLAPYWDPTSPAPVRQAAGEALVQLLGTVGTESDAEALLSRQAKTYLNRQQVLLVDDPPNVAIWDFEQAIGRFTVASYPPSRAATFVALRIADDLRRLAPASVQARRLYLVSLLESAVYRVGLDLPLPIGPGSECARAAQFGAPAISDAIAEALATGHPTAVQAAARVLEGIGDAAILNGGTPKPCPLVDALVSNDRRARFAAAVAIMSFRPKSPFAGSSYMTDAAAYFATSTGRRRAVVGFPTLPTAGQLAGLIAASGYDPQTATNGHDVFSAATQSADTELVLVSGRIGRPGAFELIQQLRGDPRTAWLPVGVLGELDDYPLQAKRFATEPKVFVVLRPEKPAEMGGAVAKGIQLSGDEIVPPALRFQQAVLALDWLAEMTTAPVEVFDVRRYEAVIEHALYNPITAPHAALAMGRLGTHSSQVALLNLASAAVQPLDVRQAAAAAFAQSVKRFGVRLAPSDVVRQYQRYNASARLDKATQQLLGGILDTIEAPTKKNKTAAAK